MPQSIQITRPGDIQVLKLIETPSPHITPKNVRIRVRAAGVNFADVMMRMGMYPDAPKTPFTPGYEIAGEIIEVGTEVSRLKPGDRVVAGTRFGGYTTETSLPETQALKIPNHLSDIEAAAIPVSFITSWIALHEMARIRKGDKVLIPSAAGGAGIASLQIAHEAGAEITGIVGSENKIAIAKQFGADHVSLQPAPKDEFDIILNSAGGATIRRNMKQLSPAGRIVLFGVSEMVGRKRSFLKSAKVILNTPFFHPISLMNQNHGVFGLNVLNLFEPDRVHLLNHILEQVLARFESGKFKVLVGKTFPLADAGAAHSYLQSRASTGKVILTC